MGWTGRKNMRMSLREWGGRGGGDACAYIALTLSCLKKVKHIKVQSYRTKDRTKCFRPSLGRGIPQHREGQTWLLRRDSKDFQPPGSKLQLPDEIQMIRRLSLGLAEIFAKKRRRGKTTLAHTRTADSGYKKNSKQILKKNQKHFDSKTNARSFFSGMCNLRMCHWFAAMEAMLTDLGGRLHNVFSYWKILAS